MSNCGRCGKATMSTIMSFFNTDMICLECEDVERKDPRYAEARKAELEAIQRGDYNYPGIGWKP